MKDLASVRDKTVYIGWIYGNEPDRRILTNLGVKGEMVWRASDNTGSVVPGACLKKGIYEHCECTEEILKRLESEYSAFCRDSFTITNERDYRRYRSQFDNKSFFDPPRDFMRRQ